MITARGIPIATLPVTVHLHVGAKEDDPDKFGSPLCGIGDFDLFWTNLKTEVTCEACRAAYSGHEVRCPVCRKVYRWCQDECPDCGVGLVDAAGRPMRYAHLPASDTGTAFATELDNLVIGLPTPERIAYIARLFDAYARRDLPPTQK